MKKNKSRASSDYKIDIDNKFQELVIVSDADELDDEEFYRKYRQKHAKIGIILSGDEDSDKEDKNYRVRSSVRRKRRKREYEEEHEVPSDFEDESMFDSESSADEYDDRRAPTNHHHFSSSMYQHHQQQQRSRMTGHTSSMGKIRATPSSSSSSSSSMQRQRTVPSSMSRRIRGIAPQSSSSSSHTTAQINRTVASSSQPRVGVPIQRPINLMAQRSSSSFAPNVPKHMESRTLLKARRGIRHTMDDAYRDVTNDMEEEERIRQRRRAAYEEERKRTLSQLPKNRAVVVLPDNASVTNVSKSTFVSSSTDHRRSSGASSSASSSLSSTTAKTATTGAPSLSSSSSSSPATTVARSNESTVWSKVFELDMDPNRHASLSSAGLPSTFKDFSQYAYIMKRQLIDCSIQVVESEIDELRFEAENATVRCVRPEPDNEYLHIYLFAESQPDCPEKRLKQHLKGQYRSEDAILLTNIDTSTEKTKKGKSTTSFIGRYRNVNNKEMQQNKLGIYSGELVVAVKCKPPKDLFTQIQTDNKFQLRKIGNLEPLRIAYSEMEKLSDHPLTRFLVDASTSHITTNSMINEVGGDSDKITSNITAIQSGILSIDGRSGWGKTEALVQSIIRIWHVHQTKKLAESLSSSSSSSSSATAVIPRIFVSVPDEHSALVLIHRLRDYDMAFEDRILYIGLLALLNNVYGLKTREEKLKLIEKEKKALGIAKEKKLLQQEVEIVKNKIIHISSQLSLCEKDLTRQAEVVPLMDELDNQKAEERRLRAKIGKLLEQNQNFERRMHLESRKEQVLEQFSIVVCPIGFTPPKLPHTLDYMLFDNAEDIPESYSLLPMIRNPCPRIILFGDSKKYERVGVKRLRSLFERLMSCKAASLSLPPTQHRMCREISDLVSGIFYQKDMTNMDRGDRNDERENGPIFPNNQYTVMLHNLKRAQPSQSSQSSSLNLQEHEKNLVHYAIQLMTHWLSRSSDISVVKGKISILCWNRRQRNNLLSLIQRIPHQHLSSLCEVTTVREFSGKQNDYIILLGPLTPNASSHPAYLDDVRKLHIGLTRARQLLHIVCNSSRMHRSDIWSRLLQEVKQKNVESGSEVRYFKPTCSVITPDATLSWLTKLADPRILAQMSSNQLRPPSLTIDIPLRPLDLNVD